MKDKLINIRTDKFSKKEITTIEECLKEWNQTQLVAIDYVGGNTDDNLDICFTLQEDDLGEFLWAIFGCGYDFVYRQ